jgi:hypothetical protein
LASPQSPCDSTKKGFRTGSCKDKQGYLSPSFLPFRQSDLFLYDVFVFVADVAIFFHRAARVHFKGGVAERELGHHSRYFAVPLEGCLWLLGIISVVNNNARGTIIFNLAQYFANLSLAKLLHQPSANAIVFADRFFTASMIQSKQVGVPTAPLGVI